MFPPYWNPKWRLYSMTGLWGIQDKSHNWPKCRRGAPAPPPKKKFQISPQPLFSAISFQESISYTKSRAGNSNKLSEWSCDERKPPISGIELRPSPQKITIPPQSLFSAISLKESFNYTKSRAGNSNKLSKPHFNRSNASTKLKIRIQGVQQP